VSATEIYKYRVNIVTLYLLELCGVSFKIFSKENSTVNGPNVAETNKMKAMIFCSIFRAAPFGYLYVKFLFNVIASNMAYICLVYGTRDKNPPPLSLEPSALTLDQGWPAFFTSGPKT
jgi:hypothetical protein